jgi:hypothetical protein
MAINSYPCKSCIHFDAIHLGGGDGNRYHNRGRCIQKSLYPFKEEPGQSFPVNAKRAPEGQLAQFCIVHGDEVMEGCSLFQARK